MTHGVRVLTASLLIAVPVLFMLFYGLLTMTFDYPGILREPAGEVLRRFAAGGPSLVLLWYGFALTPALFIPAAILLRRAFPATAPLLDLAVPLGVLAGLTQVLGLIRWPFLVPELARTFLDPAASEATQAATLTVFGAFHQYAGVAIGEHLGYLFTGAWTLVIAAAMLTAPVFRPWLGWAGSPPPSVSSSGCWSRPGSRSPGRSTPLRTWCGRSGSSGPVSRCCGHSRRLRIAPSQTIPPRLTCHSLLSHNRFDKGRPRISSDRSRQRP